MKTGNRHYNRTESKLKFHQFAMINRYNADSIRYYLLANGPEKKDTDFSWREYVNSHNGELLGAYGNFINRTLAFINKYRNGIVPTGILSSSIEEKLDQLFRETGEKIEAGNLRDAIDGIFEFVRYSNKYFDTEQPWITRVTKINACDNTIYNCVQIIANLAVLLYPFLPFSSEKVCNWLEISSVWEKQFVPDGYQLPEIEILFERIDKRIIEEEKAKLLNRGKNEKEF
ncbi:class I tRNA ligase family protein [Anaerocolumna sp. MB42-C2]|uniref:class I tRNA ligase family protein n=1 Tax=Anaerocolumna sp. MB42-C2 TaxID=3070997 RepID=UPI0027E0E0EC|nr:class I tRNA ligase family protein [Anaerocolumna sp. MB42-C2]WMJ90125.1 class I tRNA ligase family protein [Anaerocolumna sp. MB42-C2]